MIACDVNVLLNAQNRALPDQSRYFTWLESALQGDVAVGIPSLVLSGFMRIITNKRSFHAPMSIEQALDIVNKLRNAPSFVPAEPGKRHWETFTDLCRRADVKGNLVPDAYLAAIAIEHGCEWISADRNFARFPGLRWRHPLDGERD